MGNGTDGGVLVADEIRLTCSAWPTKPFLCWITGGCSGACSMCGASP